METVASDEEVRLAQLRDNRLASVAEMGALLAHEVTQPLTAAANYLSAARSIVSSNPEAVAALDKAAAQMVRVGRIIGRVGQFVARRHSEMIARSLHAIIRDAAELAAPVLRQADVNLTLRLEAAEDLVLADGVEIEQAFLNLIRAAVAALGDSPERELTIATLVADCAIQTDIADTRPVGSGSVEAELFKPFGLAAAGSVSAGLPVARSIIEAHRGRVWAASGGAIVSFTLPRAGPGSGAG